MFGYGMFDNSLSADETNRLKCSWYTKTRRWCSSDSRFYLHSEKVISGKYNSLRTTQRKGEVQ